MRLSKRGPPSESAAERGMRERLRKGERAQSHRGLIQILPHRLAIAAWQAALQVIIYLIFENWSCFSLTCQRQGGNPFGIYEWWDRRQTRQRVTEYRGCRTWNMQMRSAGFKAAVCLIAALWHCLPMTDGGFHCRGPLGVQILWFMITHDLWLGIGVRLFKCTVV